MADLPENWVDLPLAVIDVETTGLDDTEDRIIEIGIIEFQNGEVVDEYGQLIDPECPLPEETTEITGITEADLEGKPVFEEIVDEVYERLTVGGIVAYNLDFDKGFVDAELQRCGYEWPEDAPEIDPLVFAREFYKDRRRKNLGTIADILDIPLEEAHRATHDAEVAGHILFEFEERLPNKLEDLLVLQAQWESEQASKRSRWSDDEEPASFADALGSESVGLGPGYIYSDETDPLRALYKSVPEVRD